MTDITDKDIRRLDMTALLVFESLMREGKLTRVAVHLGLSQSAISHALNRLRGLFGDELFLRRPHGMEPNARARMIEPKIAALLALSRETLGAVEDFQPRESRRTWRVGALDYEAALLSPVLTTALRTEAPGMRLTFRSVTRRSAMAALQDGAIDMAVGYFWDPPSRLAAHHLFTEGYRVVYRKDHPQIGKRLTLKRYLAARHLVVSFDGALSGIADQTLERMGLSRQVVAALPLFFPALATIAETDLVATLPSRLALRHGPRFGLSVAPPPFEIRPFPVSALFHRRDAGSPFTAWCLNQVAVAIGSR